MASYKLENFIATPSTTDERLRIYDILNILRYTLEPNMAYFYKIANKVIIKVEDSEDILLDFSTATEASQAIVKLNAAKKNLSEYISIPITLSIFSPLNLNMIPLVTVNDGDLACDDIILGLPIKKSNVRVMLNGIELKVGSKVYPFDCYFSNDNGLTPRILGDERQGDKLYWNTSVAGYNLDGNDILDFIYLIETEN